MMASVFLKKTLTGLVAADEPSAVLLRSYKVGECYRANIVKPRSYKHLCLAMALLTVTFEHLPEKYAKSFATFDQFRKAVALESGHSEAFITLNGEVKEVPKSISYDAIPDDVEFGRVRAAMMSVCARILEVDEPDLAFEVAKYAEDHYNIRIAA